MCFIQFTTKTQHIGNEGDSPQCYTTSSLPTNIRGLTISFKAWLRIFDTYLIVMSEKELADKAHLAYPLNWCGGAADFQPWNSHGKNFLILKWTMWPTETSFVNIDRMLVSQLYILQLPCICWQLLAGLGTWVKNIFRDHLMGKTNRTRLKECSLLETRLTLMKAVVTETENLLKHNQWQTRD